MESQVVDEVGCLISVAFGEREQETSSASRNRKCAVSSTKARKAAFAVGAVRIILVGVGVAAAFVEAGTLVRQIHAQGLHARLDLGLGLGFLHDRARTRSSLAAGVDLLAQGLVLAKTLLLALGVTLLSSTASERNAIHLGNKLLDLLLPFGRVLDLLRLHDGATVAAILVIDAAQSILKVPLITALTLPGAVGLVLARRIQVMAGATINIAVRGRVGVVKVGGAAGVEHLAVWSSQRGIVPIEATLLQKVILGRAQRAR
ncbi:hypothetical protein BDP55DRAFT_684233 [Colletotrichum godetiae]|uniref:Uncharacterized protein n=1 Tax=Colletotrichum godetiae TaxID=1209918 RepID=A0AAJ0A7B8_9PEZI|nr:uncharacterized protein BDP55DRAFT_684233 [Colletotrichum godetiae]KAK1657837.1 hypothetical protein BDP55DRAFT_684233 [Colletotrichum godetiae]